MEKLNDYIAIYKEQLDKGDIQKAYKGLIKYMLSLKSYLSKELQNSFFFGNISLGYMDYSYFPFFNEFLREEKLRFGIVLNHEKCRFELWLMGQNADIQRKYWEMLKTTKWNRDKEMMPKYSVLEVILVKTPNFNELDILSQEIEKETIRITREIIDCIERIPTQQD